MSDYENEIEGLTAADEIDLRADAAREMDAAADLPAPTGTMPGFDLWYDRTGHGGMTDEDLEWCYRQEQAMKHGNAQQRPNGLHLWGKHGAVLVSEDSTLRANGKAIGSWVVLPRPDGVRYVLDHLTNWTPDRDGGGEVAGWRRTLPDGQQFLIVND